LDSVNTSTEATMGHPTFCTGGTCGGLHRSPDATIATVRNGPAVSVRTERDDAIGGRPYAAYVDGGSYPAPSSMPLFLSLGPAEARALAAALLSSAAQAEAATTRGRVA
jgi:hypothetical protein